VKPEDPFRILSVLAGLTIMALILQPRAHGQSSEEFEVASIKPNRGVSITSGENIAHGTVTVTNDSLRDLIKVAYGLKDFQIAGGPQWLDADRYDIIAKAATREDISDRELRSLLQSLLADRFKLRTHSEKREETAYSLVIGRKGPMLTEHAGGKESSSTTANGSLRATKATTATLASTLSRILSRPVTDNTGLKGEYDYRLQWAPTEQPDSPLPSIFSALQEQLGLKLNSTRTLVEILVIDGARKPSEN
jgi:uncharacterized protein (TIGR03435 family)